MEAKHKKHAASDITSKKSSKSAETIVLPRSYAVRHHFTQCNIDDMSCPSYRRPVLIRQMLQV